MDWKKRARFGALALAVMVLAVAALASAPAFAAKGGPNAGGGGGGGGKGGHRTPTPTPSTAVMTYAPNPVPVGSSFTVSGTRFVPNTWVNVGFYGSQDANYVMADANGSFSWTYTGLNNYCGSFRFIAIQNSTTTSVYIDVVGCP